MKSKMVIEHKLTVPTGLGGLDDHNQTPYKN